MSRSGVVPLIKNGKFFSPYTEEGFSSDHNGTTAQLTPARQSFFFL
jgi:hypothetical protein